jgi:uncharacterized protein YbaP (TraB family)
MRWHDMMRRAASLVAGALLATGSALAQQSVPQSMPQVPTNDWSIESVTVTAQAKGPAYWHATKGPSEVWILGIVEVLPKDFAWNQTRFTKLLEGKRLVLLPPRASASLFDAGWFLLTKRSLLYLPDGQTLDGVLGAPLAARFANARAVVHRDADHYEGDALPVVALKLEGDFLKAKALTYEEPADTIESLARHRDIEVHYIAKYDAMPSIEAILKSSPETSRACVEAAINDVEFQNTHAEAAAEAWAIGDVAGIKAHFTESRIFQCLFGLAPEPIALLNRATADTVSAIETALNGGGRTVAVVGIGQLLRRNGVLERLHADGIAVEGPPE